MKDYEPKKPVSFLDPDNVAFARKVRQALDQGPEAVAKLAQELTPLDKSEK